MKRAILGVCCAVLSAGAIAPAANAFVVTRTFNVTQYDFHDGVFNIGGPPSPDVPVDPVVLDFTLTYDPTITQAGPSTTGLVINSFNLPDTTEFAYNSKTGELTIGTDVSEGSIYFDRDTSFYGTYIDNAFSSHPITNGFYYGPSQPAVHTVYSSYSATINEVSNSPEPSAWALMITGISVAGASLRRRQRVTACLTS